MTQSSPVYRPQIGESVFMSLNGHQPFLTTVLGYPQGDAGDNEQLEYVRTNGRADTTYLNHAIFYPDAPVDTAFLYCVELDENNFMEKSESYELGFFFDPKSAFAFIDGILAGDIKPSAKPSAEFFDYTVRVIKL